MTIPSPPIAPHTQIPDPNLNILPSNQNAVAGISSSSPSSSLSYPISPIPPPNSHSSDVGVGSGPGPMRHPKPLTTADMHKTLETEQELLINRLSRELVTLRAAQNSSVNSNASSTSVNATGSAPSDSGVDYHLLSGPNFNGPSPRPHQRTSSNASSRSIGLSATLGSNIGVSSTPSAEPRSPVVGTRPHPITMSRQNSTTSHRSQTGSPALGSFIDPSFSYFQQQRMPIGPPAPGSSMAASPGTTMTSSTPVPAGDLFPPGLLPATSRLEETALHRSELEVAKRENESLRHRIRELERLLTDRRASDSSRTRSESVSTMASVGGGGGGGAGAGAGFPGHAVGGIAGPRERITTMHSATGSAIGIGVPDDEVKVGESAASSGVKPAGGNKAGS